jgi:hydrogenase/urease accessory protein HupE
MRRSTARAWLLLVFSLAWLARSGPAVAHTVGISRGDYVLRGDEIHAVVSFSRAELALALPELDLSGRASGVGEADRLRLARWLEPGLRFTSDTGACPGELTRTTSTEADGLMLWLRYRCSAPPHELTLQADFLDAMASGHRHLVHCSFGAKSAEAVVERATNPLHIAVPGGASNASAGLETSSWRGFRVFFVMGLEHILSGYDHLAFLLGLLLVLGPVRSLLWAITAFTIAHSVTLSVASLGIATPSPRLIEPLIAASIVYVGIENWFVKDAVGRWRITFCFGLIHGFGFAGALREVSLPRPQLPLALFSFNLGVEVGQLALVALALPALLWLHRRGWLGASRAKLASLGVSALGLFWLVARLAGS